MRNCTFWVLSPGFAMQGFTAAIMSWVVSQWNSSHLFLVPRIQQRSFGRVNTHVKFMGSSRRYLGDGHTRLLSLLFSITSLILYGFWNLASDDGMDQFSQIWVHQWVWDQVEHLHRLWWVYHSWVLISPMSFQENWVSDGWGPFLPMWYSTPPRMYKHWKTFQDQAGASNPGPQYPPAMTLFPFICESCTVRAVLGRDLTWTSGDVQLLMLERVRLIDMVHALHYTG
jgi:hypothetical protein